MTNYYFESEHNNFNFLTSLSFYDGLDGCILGGNGCLDGCKKASSMIECCTEGCWSARLTRRAVTDGLEKGRTDGIYDDGELGCPDGY
jgi:hypothetical protein